MTGTAEIRGITVITVTAPAAAAGAAIKEDTAAGTAVIVTAEAGMAAIPAAVAGMAAAVEVAEIKFEPVQRTRGAFYASRVLWA
jgi:hypothetical protein